MKIEKTFEQIIIHNLIHLSIFCQGHEYMEYLKSLPEFSYKILLTALFTFFKDVPD